MIKLAYIHRLLLLIGLFLLITAIPEMSANKQVFKKNEINSGNHNSLKTILNENLIADIDIADEDSYHQFLGIILKADFYRYGCISREKEVDFTKLQVPFHKFPHLFILFHCWKYLCLSLNNSMYLAD